MSKIEENGTALYIKVSPELREAAREYAFQRKIKGGVSALIRGLLSKKIGFEEKKIEKT